MSGATPAQGAFARARARLLAHASDPLYRSSYLLMTSTAVVAFSGFVFWIVAARLAPPAAVGVAGALLGALMLLSLVGRLGLDLALLRALPGADAARREEVVDTAMTVATGASLAAGVVFVLGTPLWSPALSFLGGTWWRALVFALMVAIWTHGSLLDSALIALRRADLVLAKTAVHSVLKVALLWLLVGPDPAGGIALAATVSLLAATLAVSVVALPSLGLARLFRPRLSWGVVRATLRSSASNYAAALALTAPLSVGALVVLARAGAEATAQFYVLWMIGSIAMMAPLALSQASLVEMTRTSDLRLLMRPRPLVIVVAVALAALAGGSLLLPLFGAHYATVGVAALLPYCLAAVPGFFLHARLAQLRVTEQHLALVVVPVATVAAFLALLALAPEPRLAGWSWLASAVLGALVGLSFRLRPAAAPP